MLNTSDEFENRPGVFDFNKGLSGKKNYHLLYNLCFSELQLNKHEGPSPPRKK